MLTANAFFFFLSPKLSYVLFILARDHLDELVFAGDGKISSSRLSGGCMIDITTGKKKVLVVCWAQQVFFSSEFAPPPPTLKR